MAPLHLERATRATQGSQSMPESMEASGGDDGDYFRFQDLPPELRLLVYRFALVSDNPICISPIRCRSGMKASLTLGLLSTCKQINKEIGHTLFENTFYINTRDFTTVSTYLEPTRFFRAKLPLVRHIVLALDTTETAAPGPLGGLPWGFSWTQLPRMNGLETARLVFIRRGKQQVNFGHYERLLQAIIERLPKDCLVKFGLKTDIDRQHALSCAATHSKSSLIKARLLKKAAKKAWDRKGCMSPPRDFRDARH